MKIQYTVSAFLLDWLYELGINHIFGVPGDYTLAFSDDVLAHKNLEWIGNCNELSMGKGISPEKYPPFWTVPSNRGHLKKGDDSVFCVFSHRLSLYNENNGKSEVRGMSQSSTGDRGVFKGL